MSLHGKMPAVGIKGLMVSGGAQGKRRFKSDLSVDMISPPMGDFRHTMHVGRGGDVFGDTSFLSNHGGKGRGGGGGGGESPDSSSTNGSKSGFFTRTFRTVRQKSVPETLSPPPRLRAGSRDLSPPPPPISPIIKNAISLPQLNMDASNGCCSPRALFPASVTADDSFYTYGLQSTFATLPRLSRLDRHELWDGGGDNDGDDSSGGVATLTRADSFTSFTVDLGPSLMSEVLGLIDDRRGGPCRGGHLLSEGGTEESGNEEEEEEEEERSAIVVDTAATAPKWTPATKTPDASMGSPAAAEPPMEAERFRRAADMLSRHYGCGGGGGGAAAFAAQRSQAPGAFAARGQKATTYAFSEEEEEIKV